MEKKQVSTFLKILQIPTDAPPEDIKESLLASGWNEADAQEAIRVLYPTYSTDEGSAPEPVTKKPQLVAQRYVKPEAEPEEKEADVPETETTFAPDSVTHPAEAQSPEPPPPEPESIPQTPVPPPQPEPETVRADATDTQPEEEFDFASVAKAHAVAAEEAVTAPSPEEEAQAEQERPHTDAPWLKEQVDIYDVTEEEKQEMIRTVYRTNERLTPQTIHALLGIDVDLSEYEAAYQRRKNNEVSGVQIVVILLSSLAIAAIALYLGLYYFEVGPFHPSITGGR